MNMRKVYFRDYNKIQEGVDLQIPPRWLNYCMYKIMSMEKNLIGRISFPVGLSLFCIARKGKS